MADFNRPDVSPLFINSFGELTPGITLGAFGNQMANVGAFTWPLSNQAFYIPLRLPFSYPVRRVFWVNGSSLATTVAVAIYARDGGLIYGSAATTASGASAIQYVSPTTPVLLPPGEYFLGILMTAGTLTSIGFGGTTTPTAVFSRLAGIRQEAVGQNTFKTVMTPVAITATGLPLFGITRTASGF